MGSVLILLYACGWTLFALASDVDDYREGQPIWFFGIDAIVNVSMFLGSAMYALDHAHPLLQEVWRVAFVAMVVWECIRFYRDFADAVRNNPHEDPLWDNLPVVGFGLVALLPLYFWNGTWAFSA